MKKRNNKQTREVKLPDGLEVAVWQLLELRRGVEKIIGGAALTREVQRLGFPRINQRLVREAIRLLRRKGHLICSMPGTKGGYWIAESREEYEAFRQEEILSRISDLAETMHAMDASAKRTFGVQYQPYLF
jgi:hypothetical protein